MIRRLPVSLRIDDEDSDFYYGFIEEKKNARELSALIMNLLHVYYENEIVRGIVEEYIVNQSPFLKINEQLQRIALEHSNTSIYTSMLDDYNSNEIKRIKKQEEKEQKEETEEKPKESPKLLADMTEDDLKKMIGNLFVDIVKERPEETAELLGIAAYGKIKDLNDKEYLEKKVNTLENELGYRKEEEFMFTGVEPKVTTPNIPIKHEEVKVEPVKEVPVESIDIASIEKPVEIEMPTEVPEVTEEPTVAEEPPKRKPASFGKLMKSIEEEEE